MERSGKGGAREALKRIQGAHRVKGQSQCPPPDTQAASAETRFGVSVVIMCMSSLLIGGEDQRQLLLDALEMGMVSDGYVFIPYDALLYAMPYQVTPSPGPSSRGLLSHNRSFVAVQSGHGVSSADQQHAASARLQLGADGHHGVGPEFLPGFS